MVNQRQRRSTTRIFLLPAVVSLVIVFGLLAALLGDGIWNVASWIALGLPIAVVALFWSRRASG